MSVQRVSIKVTFPADWTDEPALAGTTQVFWYPAEDAARLALDGFRLRGCIA